MQIVAALNVHNQPKLVLDTLDSIIHWMTNDVVVIVDEAGWDQFSSIRHKDVKFEKGYYHNYYRCPYKNVTLSLKRMYELWPHADWYCYIEYDCLVTSSFFREDLAEARKRGVWLLANDIRYGSHHLPPLVDEIVGEPVGHAVTMLGCCVFYYREYIKTLCNNFIDRFFEKTSEFKPGFFPDFHGYAFEEELYPTLATHYGGKVEELAAWTGFNWRGRNHRFPMRHPMAITQADIHPSASIIHPLKSYDDPVRNHFRAIRERKKKSNANRNPN